MFADDFTFEGDSSPSGSPAVTINGWLWTGEATITTSAIQITTAPNWTAIDAITLNCPYGISITVASIINADTVNLNSSLAGISISNLSTIVAVTAISVSAPSGTFELLGSTIETESVVIKTLDVNIDSYSYVYTDGHAQPGFGKSEGLCVSSMCTGTSITWF